MSQPNNSTRTASSTVLVAGATGLIGSHLARQLAARDQPSLLAVRRPTDLPGEPWVVDFDALPEVDLPTSDISTVFCALGTTIQRAGSRAAFERVDLDYALAFARLARHLDARHFIAVSSVGADAGSSSFYLRTKGVMEQQVSALGIPCVTFVRPSLLLGDRQEFRLAERLGAWPMRLASPLLVGPARRYRPIHASRVAAAMIGAMRHSSDDVQVLEFDQINRLAALSETTE